MKGLFAVVSAVVQDGKSRTNLRALGNLLLVLFLLVNAFSLIFHWLMQWEGQSHSWITGYYWTLTVMTTLGFGDITFDGDAGRFFSVVVLGTGVVFMLVLLPFTFIEFFYAPWMRAQAEARSPRQLPESTKRHVLLTAHDAVTCALIPMLEKYGHPYFVLCPTVTEALELDSQDVKTAVGNLDDPETYKRMRIQQADMLVTTRGDSVNTNVTFTARELSPNIPIVASASSAAAQDVLELAGATMALRLEEMMGAALARRVSIRDSDAHIIGELDGLFVAEASAAGTDLVGVRLIDSKIRARTGVSVIGTWNRGTLEIARPELEINDQTLFVLAGSKAQLEAFNKTFSTTKAEPPRVLIIGGGRVGRATYRCLRDMGIEHVKIIERNPERVASIPDAVIGEATRMDVLKLASAREASSLIITSHDDDVNVALTIFFRRLRSNWQILARSTRDRNVSTLHRAGADLVLSYAAMGSNTILNLLRGSDHLLLAEGVNIFPAPIPEAMAGRKLSDLHIRSQTGCSIIAVESHGSREVNPSADFQLPEAGRIFLIGTIEAEELFLRKFKPALQPVRRFRRKPRAV
jgi:voltage-gated potassium channel